MWYLVPLFLLVVGGYCASDANSTTVGPVPPRPPVPGVPGAVPAVKLGLAPAAAQSRRSGSDLVETLRRQLMRDNYDYQNGGAGDERRRRNYTSNTGKRESLNPPHIPRTIETSRGKSDVLAQGELRYAREPTAPGQHSDPEPQLAHGPMYEPYEPPAQRAPLDMREELGPNFSPDRRDARLDAYEPTYSNKRRDAYDAAFTLDDLQVAPVSDPRPGSNEHYTLDAANGDQPEEQDDQPVQGISAENDNTNEQDNPDQQDNVDQPDNGNQEDYQDNGEQQENSNQQDPSEGPPVQNPEYTDNRQDMKVVYDALGVREIQRPLVTRPNRLRYYTPRSTEQPRYHHNIAKKDLLYYMDESQLRRNNDVSDLSLIDPNEDRPLEDKETIQAEAKTSAISSTTTAAPRAGGQPAVRRRHRREPGTVVLGRPKRAGSKFVTVSPGNVTYKLLTMKSREGRRSGPRRFLEERSPGAVALISLDRAPFPDFRLPRSRRQYMHELQDNRPPLGDLIQHHHRRRRTGT